MRGSFLEQLLLPPRDSWHLPDYLSRDQSRQGYLFLGHVMLVLAFLAAGLNTFYFLLLFLVFLPLGFRFFRAYFSLARDPGPGNFPGVWLYLSHLLLIFGLVSLKSSQDGGVFCFSFLAGLLLLGVYHYKSQEFREQQQQLALRGEESPVFKPLASLPELLNGEHFLEKAEAVQIGPWGGNQLVLTNLRLLVYRQRSQQLTELPLAWLQRTELVSVKWYRPVAETIKGFLLFLFLLVISPRLGLFSLIFGLPLFVYLFRLKNVLVLHSEKGRVMLSGRDFNCYYFKDALDRAVKESFDYRVRLPLDFNQVQESVKKGKLGALMEKIIGQVPPLPDPLGKTLKLFEQPKLAIPRQPEFSFGLQGLFTRENMKAQRKHLRWLVWLSYLMLFLGVFFFHPNFQVLSFLGLFLTPIFLLAALRKQQHYQNQKQELQKLRKLGILSWEKVDSIRENEEESEGNKVEESKPKSGSGPMEINPSKLERHSAMLRYVLLFGGWLLILTTLLIARVANDGAIYFWGLMLALLGFVLERFLQELELRLALRRFQRHELQILQDHFPWLVKAREPKEWYTPFFRYLTLPGRFLDRILQPRSLAPAAHRFYRRPGPWELYYRKKGYLKVAAGFVLILLIIAIMAPNFGVWEAEIPQKELDSQENPGWTLEEEHTELDLMKTVYVSFRRYQDLAKDDEGYPALLILITLKIPLVELSESEMVDSMRDEMQEHEEEEGVIVENETARGVRRNVEGREVHFFVYNGTVGETTTIFTKGKITKVLGAVWHSEKNSLHIAIGFAQVSNLTLQHVGDIPLPNPIPIPNPVNTTDETTWHEMFNLVFKARTRKV